MSCVVWHFIHQGTNSYCVYLTRHTKVQEGQEYLGIKILPSFHSKKKKKKPCVHPLNGERGKGLFALLVVMHRLGGKRALNNSV